MIEVRIPKEIKEYKPKFLFNLTFRQLSTTALALIICVPLYLFGREYIHEEILSWLIMLIAGPIVLIGWFSYNQMTFEQFILAWFKMFWNKQKRPYQELPPLYYVREEHLKQHRKEVLDYLYPMRKKKDE